MESSLARKIEKANQYAAERERFVFKTFTIRFHGDNHEHVVNYDDKSFRCDCEYFSHHTYCAHILALEKMLAPMVPERIE